MRNAIVVAVILALGGVSAAAGVMQKATKDATKGAAKGVEENAPQVRDSTKQLIDGVIDAAVERRRQLGLVTNDIAREAVRGLSGSISFPCKGDPACVETKADGVAFSLGEGLAHGLSARFSLLPWAIGFFVGFLFAALLALMVGALRDLRGRARSSAQSSG